MELMTQEVYDKVLHDLIYQARKICALYGAGTTALGIAEAKKAERLKQAHDAYAAALECIASLEAQLAAQREQIERLLAEAAHS